MTLTQAGTRGFRAYTAKHLDELLQRAGYDTETRLRIRAVASVLPFRTNGYVVDELIDWSDIPGDPIYRLVFPQEDMLPESDVSSIAALLRSDAPAAEIQAAANKVRMTLNPHPAGQMELNMPRVGTEPMPGVQHKYPETVLFFPKQGQTCHAYCTYCFRWAQFVGEPDLKMASDDVQGLVRYLREHPRVTSVLITGGDPMIMSAPVLRRYVEPLLALDQLESIRIGTKSLAYWPGRFVTDPDAADVLRLFSTVVESGKNLAFMAHFSHPREMEPELVQTAVRAIRDTGAVIRTQAPLIRTINDRPEVWERMWRAQLALGMVPYYMFVERDTGPQDYFAVPLARAYEIYRDAYARVSGLCRTVRGPSMSATPGKVCVDGVAEVAGRRVFVLHLIQARDPSLVGRPFFAEYDPSAVWLDDLRPAFADRFPFETGASDAARPPVTPGGPPGRP
ncbi:KamA family radical SAM protein [Sphaerisporangium siamense]|uniref:KamA family protein n=1 Tax=Sphaerisporangium siamense TaxID=795645 RepID=A0A7W7GAX4_9ACTN|nr:lysine 2,3-aminomutase [Sphaerisporangium siamense]MBB4700421.1 KamA family protein [Sphaerisporangium siamense]GII88417.1 KamA family radical SAM protein [Sphaerisporangium siamense]